MGFILIFNTEYKASNSNTRKLLAKYKLDTRLYEGTGGFTDSYRLTEAEQLEIQEQNILNGWPPARIRNLEFLDGLKNKLADESHMNEEAIITASEKRKQLKVYIESKLQTTEKKLKKLREGMWL